MFAFCGTGVVADTAAAFAVPKVEQTPVIKSNGPIIVMKEGFELFSLAVWGNGQIFAVLECRICEMVCKEESVH